MKKINILFIFIFLLFASTLLAFGTKRDVIAGKDYIDTVLQVDDFDKIEVGNIFQVEYTQVADEKSKVQVSAPANLFEFLDVSSEGGKLSLTLKEDTPAIKGKFSIIFRVQSPSLTEVKIDDIAKFTAKEPVRCETFRLQANNVSTVNFNSVETRTADIEASGISKLTIGKLDCEEIKLESTGAAKIDISGKSGSAIFVASGTSFMDIWGLAAAEITGSATGASKVKCQPTNKLSLDSITRSSKINCRTSSMTKARQ